MSADAKAILRELDGPRQATRASALSVPLALTAIVVAASAVHAYFAWQIASPWIVPDEIRYSELVKSLGGAGLPAIRGDVTFGFGLGYPLLLAPIWAVFDDVAVAYTTAKLLNSVLLALTAVPAYFLGRRFVSERLALVAAALSVCIPSLLYAGMLMTEVALYPAFVLAVLAISVATERPNRSTQLAALGAIALASTVKVLAATLFAGYLAAILLFGLLDTRGARPWLDRLRAYRTTWWLLAGAALAALGLEAMGQGPTTVLGVYGPFLETTDLSAVPRWMYFHIAAFDLFVAVIPFAASTLVVAAGLRATAERSVRLFTALCLTLSVPIFAAVAAYSSSSDPPSGGYASGAGANERATFVLAPLALIGLMVWLRDRPGSRRMVVAAGVLAAVLPAAVPLDRFSQNVVKVQAFSLIPWTEAPEITQGRVGMVVVSIALGAVFVVLALARAPVVAMVAPVAAAFVISTMIAQIFVEEASDLTRRQGVGDAPGWVDAAVDGESVSVLWYETPGMPWALISGRHRIVWLNEFYNRSIGDVYELGSPIPYGVDLASTPVRLDHGVVVTADGRPAPMGHLVLAPCYVRIDGEAVARDPDTGATVYRVEGPVHAQVSKPQNCGTG